MDALKLLLTNSALANIAEGVISGVLVALLSYWIVNLRRRKEYWRRVELANRDVLLALRATVSEEYTPGRSLIAHLCNSVARSYHVRERDVARVDQIFENLIKEVMDTVFLSPATKDRICNLLLAGIEGGTPPSTPGTAGEVTVDSTNAGIALPGGPLTWLVLLLGLIPFATKSFIDILNNRVSSTRDISLGLTGVIVGLLGTYLSVYYAQKGRREALSSLREQSDSESPSDTHKSDRS